MKFSNLLDTFDEGIFSKLNAKAIELQKMGKRIFNLFVGTPDLKPDDAILNEISTKTLNPELAKYSLHDIDELKEAFIKHYKKRFNVTLDKDEIATCNGTQEGMCHIGMLFGNPGDYCLLPNPGYIAFEASAKLARQNIDYYPLLEENDFMPRLDLLDEEILKRAKYIIISYPSNPTGVIITKERYAEIIKICKKYDIIIVNDNAYSDIIYDDNESFSYLSLDGAKDIGCEFYSLSKSYNTTGLRISFLVGNKEIITNFKKLRSQYDFGMYYPFQYAAIKAFEIDYKKIEAQRLEYQKRRDILCDGLAKIGYKVYKSKGTMFIFVRIPDKYENSMDFTIDLLEKANVLATPGISFGSLGNKYVRFALVKDQTELKEALESIKNANLI